MKSIAASKAKMVFTDATVLIERSTNDRRADVLVEFERSHPRIGLDLAIEVLHEHRSKDIRAIQQNFLAAGYSVLWLNSDQYVDHNVDLDAVNSTQGPSSGCSPRTDATDSRRRVSIDPQGLI